MECPTGGGSWGNERCSLRIIFSPNFWFLWSETSECPVKISYHSLTRKARIGYLLFKRHQLPSNTCQKNDNKQTQVGERGTCLFASHFFLLPIIWKSYYLQKQRRVVRLWITYETGVLNWKKVAFHKHLITREIWNLSKKGLSCKKKKIQQQIREKKIIFLYHRFEIP